jgi:hypothetical protein
MGLSFYAQVEKNRKVWSPIEPVKSEAGVPGSEDTLSRCFSLKALEIPVKDFILDGLARSESQILGEEGKASLLRNTIDEEKHDIALYNCIKVFSAYNKDYERLVAPIVEAWINHPDHPITKAATLENGIFFVVLPIYRQFGGEAARMTSLDISADERNHVQLHRYAAKELGYRPSKSLDNLRKATVDWLVEKFEVPGYNKEVFLKASDSLMYKGITSELDFTRTSTVPAFFERRSDTLPSYS